MEIPEWSSLLSPLAATLVAFCISAIATPVIRYLARRHGFVAQPRPDRWHQRPTALLGGVAIYLGLVVPLLIFSPSGSGLRLLSVGLTGTFILGLVDDLVKLRPQQKLVGQIALASLVAAGGIIFRGLPLAILAVPVTVFWLVAITNAFNLLDNMDGLTAGVACVSGLVLAIMGMLAGNLAVAVASACMVGACIGFLLYNSSPASIFMGDAGSLTLGFAVGGLAVLGNGYGASQNVLLTLIVPIAILSVPLFDTTLVSVMRTLAGRSISQGGRDHTSHRLVALGLSESQTVRVLYVISAIFGGFAISTAFLDVFASVVVLGLLVVALVLFGTYLAQVKVYHDDQSPAHEGSGRTILSIGTAVSQKMPIGEVILDTVLIVVAYLASYLLKFESIIDGPFLIQFARSLPYVIALKLAVLLVSGAYQGGWRHTSLPQAVALGKASTLGSLVSVVAVAVIWRFDDFSRSVFVIDWLLFTWLLVLSRLSFRLLGHWVQSASGAREGRLLVVGSSGKGEAVVRAIQQGVFGDFVPVGFVIEGDDKRGGRVVGVPVLGTLGQFETVVKGLEIDGVIAVMDVEPAETDPLVSVCRRLGLPFRQITPLEIPIGGSTVAGVDDLRRPGS